MKAIVYTSDTGFTKRYALMLGEKTKLPVYSLRDCSVLKKGESVIYMGWRKANTVVGYKKAAKRFNIKAVCGVGLCPTGELLKEVRSANRLGESLPLFTLQGGLMHDKLKGINKFMINMLIKILSSKKDATDEDKAQLQLIIKGGDYVKEENLQAVTDFIKAH